MSSLIEKATFIPGKLTTGIRNIVHFMRGSPGERAYDEFQVHFEKGSFCKAVERLDCAVNEAPGFSKYRKARVRLVRFGFIDLQVCLDDLEALTHHPDKEVQLRAHTQIADLLWERIGATQQALDSARTTINSKLVPASFKLRMAALISNSGRMLEAIDVAENVAKKAPETVQNLRFVSLAKVLHEHTPLTMRYGELANRILDRLNEGKGQFQKLVTTSGLNHTAIVANGPSALGQNNGEDVDNHKCVIRFNNFDCSTKRQIDYGSRIDIWMRSGFNDYVTRKLAEGTTHIVVLSANPQHRFGDGVDMFCNYLESDLTIETVPFDIYKDLFANLNASPSAGLVGAYWTHQCLGSLSEKNLFGYSLHLNSERQAVYADKIVSVKRPGRHNWKNELQLLNRLVVK